MDKKKIDDAESKLAESTKPEYSDDSKQEWREIKSFVEKIAEGLSTKLDQGTRVQRDLKWPFWVTALSTLIIAIATVDTAIKNVAGLLSAIWQWLAAPFASDPTPSTEAMLLLVDVLPYLV